MDIGVIGINYKTASLVLNEVVAKNALLLKKRAGYLPMIILTTCNRTEIYFSSDDLVGTSIELIELLQIDINHCLYTYFRGDCFAHLSRVVSGLDSAVCMETEIAGQVKKAYLSACKTSMVSSELHYLFQKAFKVGKGIRSGFISHRFSPSLLGTLYDIAQNTFGDLKERKCLLVGYSNIHRKLISFLQKKGVIDITVCSRQPKKIPHCKAISREELISWNEYDLISTATQADGFLISGEGKQQHLIFDLGLPRNVDPSVESDGVTLYNMEKMNMLLRDQKEQIQDFIMDAETFLMSQVEKLETIYDEKKIKTLRAMDI